MPEWLQKIIDAFKKANPAATAEQLKEFEDAAKAAAPPTQTPPAQKPDEKPGQMQLPPEVQAALDASKKQVEELNAQLKLVVDDTKARQTAQAADLQAAQAKRYTDHVSKLLTEGRVTKAEHDAMVNPESGEYKKFFGSLDVFIETSAKWSPNKTLATPVKVDAAGRPATPDNSNPAASTEDERQKMADELKDAKA